MTIAWTTKKRAGLEKLSRPAGFVNDSVGYQPASPPASVPASDSDEPESVSVEPASASEEEHGSPLASAAGPTDFGAPISVASKPTPMEMASQSLPATFVPSERMSDA